MRQLCILAFTFCAALVTAYSADVTIKIKGSYVFTEEGTAPNGQPVAALAMLTFSDSGSVTGKKMMAAGTGLQSSDVQGSFTVNADGTGMLMLSTASTDEDGNTLTLSESYNLLVSQDGSIVNAVRVNDGYFTIAKLSQSSANSLKGIYSFAERAAGRPFARIVQLNFDGTSNVSGFQIVESQNGNGMLSLKGSSQNMTNGFGSLALSSTTTNDDGEAQTAVENYFYLSTATGVKMVRTDSGVIGVIDLTR